MSRPYERKSATPRKVPAAQDQWYVLHVLSNKERRAVENLKRLFKEDEELGALLQSEPLVPTEKVEEVRNGKKVVQERKLYPGYVYLNFALRDSATGALNNDAWYKIQAVDGVISFACGRSKEPLPMSAKDVADFKREVERRSEGTRQKIVINVQDEVVVLEGAFQGERGIVEEVDSEHGRLRVGVTMFGRSNPLDLDYTQVQIVPEDERNIPRSE